MSYFPTPFGHLADWRVDPRDPKPRARARLRPDGRERGVGDENRDLQTPEPPSLRLNLPSGSINVYTSDTAETRIELSGPNEDDARIEYRRNEIVVEIEWKKLFGRANFVRDHRLEIYAPNGSQIDAHTASGDVEGRGTFGEVSIDSASGDIRPRAGRGAFRAQHGERRPSGGVRRRGAARQLGLGRH